MPHQGLVVERVILHMKETFIAYFFADIDIFLTFAA